jgi:hypothetical protein
MTTRAESYVASAGVMILLSSDDRSLAMASGATPGRGGEVVTA